jgi:hypothetical protein
MTAGPGWLCQPDCVGAELYLLHHGVRGVADLDIVPTVITVPNAQFEINVVRENSSRHNGCAGTRPRCRHRDSGDQRDDRRDDGC